MGESGGPAQSATDRAPAGCSHRAVHAGGRVPSNTPRRAIEAALAQVVLSGDGPMGAGPAPACQQPSFAPALRAGETAGQGGADRCGEGAGPALRASGPRWPPQHSLLRKDLVREESVVTESLLGGAVSSWKGGGGGQVGEAGLRL